MTGVSIYAVRDGGQRHLMDRSKACATPCWSVVRDNAEVCRLLAVQPKLNRGALDSKADAKPTREANGDAEERIAAGETRPATSRENLIDIVQTLALMFVRRVLAYAVGYGGAP